jgi:hypothetical protein
VLSYRVESSARGQGSDIAVVSWSVRYLTLRAARHPCRPTAGISGPDCGIFFTSTLALSARALSCARAPSNAGGAYFFLRVLIRPVVLSAEQEFTH